MKILITFLIVLLFGAGPSLTWALQLTPSYQMYRVKAGKKVTGEYLLTNNEKEIVHVSPETKNWVVNDDNKSIKASDWLTVDTTKFDLEPGESRRISFEATAPKKAKGEMVGMVSLKTTTAIRKQVQFVMSSAIYLAVIGTEEMSAKLVEISARSTEQREVHAGVVVQNNGNVHIRPAGMFRIFDAEGRPYANIHLERGQPTHPGFKKSYVGKVADLSLKPGKYKAVVTMRDLDRDVDILTVEKKFRVRKNLTVKW